MTADDQKTDIEFVALLALHLYESQCFGTVAEMCSRLPATDDMRIPVALKLLGSRCTGLTDRADSSAVVASFMAHQASSPRPSSAEILASLLTAVSASGVRPDGVASPQDVSADLENASPTPPVAADHPVELAPPNRIATPGEDASSTSPSPRRGRKLIGLAGLAAVVIAGGASFVMFGSSENADTSQAAAPTTIRPVTTALPTTTAQRPTSTAAPVATSPPSTTTAPPTSTTTTPPSTTTTPPTSTTISNIHQEIARHPYFAALARFSFQDALEMQENAVYGSPAWAYGRHLAQGFRADARTANATTLIRESLESQAEFCINTSCFAIDGVQLANPIYDFSLGGRYLSTTTGGWERPGAQRCVSDLAPNCIAELSVVVGITSVHQVGTASFVTVEISNGGGSGLTMGHVSTSIHTSAGWTPASVQVGPTVNPGMQAVWLYRFGGIPSDPLPSLRITSLLGGREFTWELGDR
jgi:hypothetical protein